MDISSELKYFIHFTCFFLLFYVATRKFLITCMAYNIFLLDSAALEYSTVVAVLVTKLCPTLHDPMGCSSPGSSAHGIFPGKNTGLCCHFLLKRIFMTQRSNVSLLHWQENSLPLSHITVITSQKRFFEHIKRNNYQTHQAAYINYVQVFNISITPQ